MKKWSALGPAALIVVVLGLVTTSAMAQKRRDMQRGVRAAWISAPAKRVTPHQRQDAQARIELSSAIVNRLQLEAAARGLSAQWQQPALETLLPLPLEALERVSQRAVNLDALAPAVVEAANDPNLLGDPDEDLVYTPIDPCRFIDTRSYAGGPINGIRGFDLDVTGASYGGTGTCNPTAALGASGDAIGAISANLTIVGPAAAPGFLAVKPTANSPVSSLVNWYQAGPTVQLANAGIFQTVNGLDNFLIQTSTTTHVLMDILGAFIRPEATALQQTIVQDSVPVPSGAEGFNASPNCPAGFTLTGGGCFTDVLLHDTEATYPGTSTAWNCSSNNASAIASSLVAYAVCARVPGR